MVWYDKMNMKLPDWVREKAKTPRQTGFLPQTESCDGSLERHGDRPVAKVKFTERYLSSLWGKNNFKNKTLQNKHNIYTATVHLF